MCPTLSILEPRPALVAQYAEALVEAMGAVSPLVEEAEQCWKHEFGTVNALVSRDLVEAHRDIIRTAPFMRVRGPLEERAREQRTLIVEEVEELLPAEVLAMPHGKEFG